MSLVTGENGGGDIKIFEYKNLLFSVSGLCALGILMKRGFFALPLQLISTRSPPWQTVSCHIWFLTLDWSKLYGQFGQQFTYWSGMSISWRLMQYVNQVRIRPMLIPRS